MADKKQTQENKPFDPVADQRKRDREHLKNNLHPVFHEPLGLNDPEEEEDKDK